MKIGKTLTQQVSEYSDKVLAKRERAQAREYNKKMQQEVTLEGSWKLPDEILSTKVVRGPSEEEVKEAVVEKETIYWEFVKEEADGSIYIKVLGPDEHKRINEMVAKSKQEYIARLNRLKDGLAHATLKAEMIDRIIADDKRTRVIPGRSLLHGNNVEVIAERHAVESTKGDKQVTRQKGTYKKEAKIVNDNRLSI
jgi:hypothetical protein